MSELVLLHAVMSNKHLQVLSLDKVAPSSQGDLFTEERNCQDTMDVMETDQENNVNIHLDSSKNMVIQISFSK